MNYGWTEGGVSSTLITTLDVAERHKRHLTSDDEEASV